MSAVAQHPYSRPSQDAVPSVHSAGPTSDRGEDAPQTWRPPFGEPPRRPLLRASVCHTRSLEKRNVVNKKKIIAAAAAFGVAASLLRGRLAGERRAGVDQLRGRRLRHPAGRAQRPVQRHQHLGRQRALDCGRLNDRVVRRHRFRRDPDQAGGPRFGRPNGSGDGVTALSRSIDGAAYTSATPGAPTVVITGPGRHRALVVGCRRSVANGPLLYIPFGRDALSYAHSGGANAAFDNIDQATLKGIFECTITTGRRRHGHPRDPAGGLGHAHRLHVEDRRHRRHARSRCVEVGQEHDTQAPRRRHGLPGQRHHRDVGRPVGGAEHRRGHRPPRRRREDRLADRRHAGRHGHGCRDGSERRVLRQQHLGPRHLHRRRERPRDRWRPEVRRQARRTS